MLTLDPLENVKRTATKVTTRCPACQDRFWEETLRSRGSPPFPMICADSFAPG
jgi:hypothetical protein